MNIQQLHKNFQMPVRSTEHAAAFDLFMPEGGVIDNGDAKGKMFKLGFAAEVPPGYVAFLLPRSGSGAKHGVSLNNTVGVIDPDYRGEWAACLRRRDIGQYSWEAGERLLQMVLVPVHTPTLTLVDTLSDTERGDGGFGSTGTGDVK